MNYGKKVEEVVIVDALGAAIVFGTILMSGRICRVDYSKKNGDNTTMICRTGVKKYLKGTGTTTTDTKKGLIGVYSFDRKGYRTLNVANIMYVKSGSTVYDFRRLHGEFEFKAGVYGVELFGSRTIPAITSPLFK
jgi:hypothetical protein